MMGRFLVHERLRLRTVPPLAAKGRRSSIKSNSGVPLEGVIPCKRSCTRSRAFFMMRFCVSTGSWLSNKSNAMCLGSRVGVVGVGGIDVVGEAVGEGIISGDAGVARETVLVAMAA